MPERYRITMVVTTSADTDPSDVLEIAQEIALEFYPYSDAIDVPMSADENDVIVEMIHAGEAI